MTATGRVQNTAGSCQAGFSNSNCAVTALTTGRRPPQQMPQEPEWRHQPPRGWLLCPRLIALPGSVAQYFHPWLAQPTHESVTLQQFADHLVLSCSQKRLQNNNFNSGSAADAMILHADKTETYDSDGGPKTMSQCSSHLPAKHCSRAKGKASDIGLPALRKHHGMIVFGCS